MRGTLSPSAGLKEPDSPNQVLGAAPARIHKHENPGPHSRNYLKGMVPQAIASLAIWYLRSCFPVRFATVPEAARLSGSELAGPLVDHVRLAPPGGKHDTQSRPRGLGKGNKPWTNSVRMNAVTAAALCWHACLLPLNIEVRYSKFCELLTSHHRR